MEIGPVLVKQKLPICILLMCDRPLERRGIRLIIEEQPGMKVVGDIGNSIEGLGPLLEQADIVLLAIDADSRDGLHSLPQIVEMAGKCRVIVLTGPCRPEVSRRIARLGAMGVISKDQPIEVLVKAIEKVHAGEIWFDRMIMAGLILEIAFPKRDDDAAARIAALTKREREIVQLLGEGFNTEELAERLFISVSTVRHHLTAILGKLGVRDRFELVFYAYKHGLAVPPRWAGQN